MNRKTRRATHILFSMALLLTLLCPPALVFGQEARGSISGIVRDVNQAVIAAAPVKVNNLARGTSVSLTTNDAGYFRAPYLVPVARRRCELSCGRQVKEEWLNTRKPIPSAA